MTRDFKNRAEPREQPTRRCSRAMPFITGLLIGAFAVGFAWLKLDPGLLRSGGGLNNTGIPRPKVDANARPPASASFEFEFPDLLKEMKVDVGQDRPEPAPAPPPVFAATEKPQPPAQEAFELQIGSFRKSEDAERLKAQLALMGVVTRIQQVTIDGGQTFHRVRSGPYRNQQELENTRALLSRNNINPILVKWGN